MKIIIELEGQQARRAWRLLSESFIQEPGQPAEASALSQPDSFFAANVITTDAGPAAPDLFRAFGHPNDAEAVEKALADLSPSRRPLAEPWHY